MDTSKESGAESDEAGTPFRHMTAETKCCKIPKFLLLKKAKIRKKIGKADKILTSIALLDLFPNFSNKRCEVLHTVN